MVSEAGCAFAPGVSCPRNPSGCKRVRCGFRLLARRTLRDRLHIERDRPAPDGGLTLARHDPDHLTEPFFRSQLVRNEIRLL